MTTSMQEALKQANVKTLLSKPLVERVWLYLKDHPSMTARQMCGIYGKSAPQVLSYMEDRKMVTSKLENRLTGSGRQKAGRQLVKVFTTVGREYELLPPSKKTKPAADPKPLIYSAPPPPIPLPLPTSAPVTDSAVFPKPTKKNIRDLVDSWTLSDAREIYNVLKEYFA